MPDIPVKIVQMQNINPETNEVVEDIMPATLASAVKCTDGNTVEKKIADNTTYSNDTPIITPIGSIEANETFSDVPITEMLTKILYGYVKPTITLSASITGGYKEIGTSISPKFTATATKKSNPITSLSIMRDGNVVESVTDGTAQLIVDIADINSTTTIKAQVADGKSTVDSTSVTYTFVYPMYIGKVSDIAASAITADMVTAFPSNGGTKKVQAKGSVNLTYSTLATEKMVAACPPGWTLSKITDPNGFDITASFETVNLNIEIAGQAVAYTLYVSKNATSQTAFKVTFA